jgi:hypothetical protein
VSQHRRLIVCAQPSSSNWQVTIPSTGSVLLVGWTESSQPVDGGMPDWVQSIFADAFCARHVVTFPSTTDDTERAERVTALRVSGLKRFLDQGAPRDFKLISTRDRALVCRAFDDPGFPWWMQGQFLLLTPLEAPQPRLDADETIQMLAPPANDPNAWSLEHVAAQVRAGVDGDVAVIFSVSALVEKDLTSDLASAAAAAHIGMQQLSEVDFAAALAGGT